MRRILPGPDADLSDADLRAAYAFPVTSPWLRVMMATTLDGAIHGSDGLSGSISTPVDRRAFQASRAAADVVLVAAGTLRAEDYRPSTRPLAIVSGRLDLPDTLRIFTDATPDHARPVVLTTATAAAGAAAHLRDTVEIVACGAYVVDLRMALEALHARGLTRVQCEGGPGLLGGLLAADLVDELLLTLLPSLLGSTQHLTSIPGGLGHDARFTVAQVVTEEGTVLTRLVRARC